MMGDIMNDDLKKNPKNDEKEDFSSETKEVISKVFFVIIIILVIWLVLFNIPEKEFKPLSLSKDIIDLSNEFFIDELAGEDSNYEFEEYSIEYEEVEFGKYVFESKTVVNNLTTGESKEFKTIWDYNVQFDTLNLQTVYYDDEIISEYDDDSEDNS
ncbi:MAG: hypothetical protein PWQ77_164 [Kosmotogales bacterium]|nr:hypothetical protein [Kosmotogales bacterium]